MTKILFICHGNICRSPMAEYVLKDMVEKRKIGIHCGIPSYCSANKLVIEAAKMSEHVRYVGWDVAITENGASLIEGNCYPGIYQIKPSFLKEKEGLIPTYEKAMNINIDKIYILYNLSTHPQRSDTFCHLIL